jgi:hypothetical protein
MRASLRSISSKRCGKEIQCGAVQNETNAPITTPVPNITSISSENNFQASKILWLYIWDDATPFSITTKQVCFHQALTKFFCVSHKQGLLEVFITIVVPVVSAFVGVCILGICFKCFDLVRARKRKAEENGEEWNLCPKLPSCKVSMPFAEWRCFDKLAGCFRRQRSTACTGKSDRTEVSCIAV